MFCCVSLANKFFKLNKNEYGILFLNVMKI